MRSDIGGPLVTQRRTDWATKFRLAHKVQPEPWFVYILRCADGTLYTGITKDVNRRCEQHNAGTASRYTRGRLPVSVVYQETQATQSLALKRETAIKAMSRQQKESLIGELR